MNASKKRDRDQADSVRFLVTYHGSNCHKNKLNRLDSGKISLESEIQNYQDIRGSKAIGMCVIVCSEGAYFGVHVGEMSVISDTAPK